MFVIDGGNHSEVANYGEQSGDGNAFISSDEQQDYVIKKLSEQ